MGNILKCFTGEDDHGDDDYYRPSSGARYGLQAGSDHGHGPSPYVDVDQPAAASRPHHDVVSLLQDLLYFESTSMVPEALRQHVTSSKKAQVKWYRNILEAYNNMRPQPKTPEEAAQLITTALSRIQRADLLVHHRCIGDGDGFSAYVDTADPRESANVALEVHEMVIDRTQARTHRDYQKARALLRSLDEAGYKIINISGEEILAKKYRIRMRGIDAPELEMTYGKESKDALVKLIGGKRVTIHVYGLDQFGRYVGDIYCDNVFVQERMLKSGHAWHFKTYDKRPEFAQWEREARAAHRGLWASDNPEKPWDWRREQRSSNIQVY
ncbi:unnamed protein product [Urochloa decumbens]|uniref:TNase-like domain-containing protein n=1 Tax=Urochloa decumbens TaxID=240449 RepID=A0ABC9GWL0_9POAL